MSLAHHCQSKSTAKSSVFLNDSFYRVNNSLSSHTGGKHPPSSSSSSIELDHPYSCSSRRVSQALRTLAEPLPPSPSSSPPLSSSNSISTPQQMMLLSTPPTPPPSSTINNNEIDMNQQEQSEEEQQQFYTKSSSTFVLSPTTPFFPSHHPSYGIPSTPPPPSPSSSSQTSSALSTKQTPSSCGLVQLVQLHRIHPPTKTHKFASSTPVTTSDSWYIYINVFLWFLSSSWACIPLMCMRACAYVYLFLCFPAHYFGWFCLFVVSFISSHSFIHSRSFFSLVFFFFYVCLFVCMCNHYLLLFEQMNIENLTPRCCFFLE